MWDINSGVFFFKQKTAYEMRISDWSSDVCSSDLVERLAIRLIALRAPMADDLREVVAALKIATVVERIGAYAKHIAKRVPAIEDNGRIEPLSRLPAMAQMVGERVPDVLDPFSARDAPQAITLSQRATSADRQVGTEYVSQSGT